MLSQNIENLTITELCDLLVTNTSELLGILNQRGSNGESLHDKKKDVESIQAAILKSKSGHSSLFPNTTIKSVSN